MPAIDATMMMILAHIHNEELFTEYLNLLFTRNERQGLVKETSTREDFIKAGLRIYNRAEEQLVEPDLFMDTATALSLMFLSTGLLPEYNKFLTRMVDVLERQLAKGAPKGLSCN